ncbi:MAG: polysaccharide biosynthesis tyrosine autokinase [Flavobacteriia bacterium]|nr:polysaccharide biosynthesis tyrosine autokinase [Flavobacteriia bacterium]NBV90944.1 polysaccharide biosynthesis tyrosine autokinase [Flavobacteriia bacterium]
MNKNSFIVNDQFNPTIVGIVLRRHWYKPLMFTFAFLTLAFVYLRYKKPVYSSTALLQIVRENKVKQVLGDGNQITPETQNLSKDVELLRSPVLVRAAIESMHLNTSVYNRGRFLTEDLFGVTPFSIITYYLKDSSLCEVPIYISEVNKGTYRLQYSHNNRKKSVAFTPNSKIENEDFSISINANRRDDFARLVSSSQIYFVFNNPSVLLNQLQQGLTITPIDENAKTIEISLSNANPKLCYGLVSSILETYFNFEKKQTQNNNNQTIAFIENQLDSLSMVLDDSKENLYSFQRDSKLPNPEFEEASITKNIGTFSERINEINEEISVVNYVNAKITADASRLEIYKIIPELAGRKLFEGSITRQLEDLNKLLENKEDLLQDVTSESKQIRLINDRISSRINSIRKSMSATSDRLKHEKRLLDNELGKYENKYLTLPEKTMEYNRLKYLEDLNRTYYNLFTEKKIEYQLNNAGYTSENRLLSVPEIPLNPVSPNRKNIVFLAIGFSLFFGLALLLFYYLTYNEITSLSDLKKLLPEEIAIIGTVPLYRKKKMVHSQIVVKDSPKSQLSESVRSIKSNLNFINKDAKLIAISSSISGEGKTFVVLNLAATFASEEKRVLVIDLDLRKPKIHLGFNVDNNVGMSQVLSKLITLEASIQHSGIANLDFITAGPIPPNPSDLIQSPYFHQILEELKLKYDVILIDNPPVGIVSDGIQILAMADIPIYVFKANYSKRVFAGQIQNLFKIQKIDKLNVVLNGVTNNGNLYGYSQSYGGYGYGHTYSGYYSDDIKEPFWKRILFFWKKSKNH